MGGARSIRDVAFHVFLIDADIGWKVTNRCVIIIKMNNNNGNNYYKTHRAVLTSLRKSVNGIIITGWGAFYFHESSWFFSLIIKKDFDQRSIVAAIQ